MITESSQILPVHEIVGTLLVKLFRGMGTIVKTNMVSLFFTANGPHRKRGG